MRAFDIDKVCCIHVHDFLKEGKTHSESIRDCLNFVSVFEHRTLIFDKINWKLDEAIVLPSHTTVIIDGVILKQNDYVFDNVFRADNMVLDENDPNGYPLSMEQACDIKILGKNGACIIGPDRVHMVMHPSFPEGKAAEGDYWGRFEVKEQPLEGDYWGWRNFQIQFSMCSDFELGGLTFYQQPSWGVVMARCQNGYIHDLEFHSTTKNGDGINVRCGCSHILIENIKGDTTDDLIAINSGAPGKKVQYPRGDRDRYIYPNIPSDIMGDLGETIEERYIHDITVQNVYSHAVSGVALLCRGGHKIFNILIQNVYDMHTAPFVHTLYGGDGNNLISSYPDYGVESYTPGDMHNVRINNVVCHHFKNAVAIYDVGENIWIHNVVQNRKDGLLLDYGNKEEVRESIQLTACVSAAGDI